MADSYRKSAALLDAKLASRDAAAGRRPQPPRSTTRAKPPQAAAQARPADQGAASCSTRSIEHLPRQAADRATIDKLYLKLTHFYRADCLYDLGDTRRRSSSTTPRRSATRTTRRRWRRTCRSSTRTAPGQSRGSQDRQRAGEVAAAEDAAGGVQATAAFSMPKEYWEQWLKWTSDSGMW